VHVLSTLATNRAGRNLNRQSDPVISRSQWRTIGGSRYRFNEPGSTLRSYLLRILWLAPRAELAGDRRLSARAR
jgi:hypothetical protein